MTRFEQGLTYLRKALNTPTAEFREGQWEAIRQIVDDRATLLLVRRTGWGKSMVYFLATRLLRDRGAGPTILISPLLALMRNQIEAAGAIDLRAETINSTNTDAWENIERQLREGKLDLLLISPERLSNTDFRERVLSKIASAVGLFVVDEAHCISDWGHDFRPDYQRITRILQAMPKNVPVLATTATANDRVVEDVVDQLGAGVRVSRGPLARASLGLQNVKLLSPTDRMAWLAEYVPQLPGSGIIYALTVRDARRIAEWLKLNGINAPAYSGRLDGEKRETLEQALLKNEVKALVATVALGMGFDKPDLGFVVHYQRPGSVVHYYQQVGRAGRNGHAAYGILLQGREDDDIIDYFIRTSFPAEAHVSQILRALEEAEQGLKIHEIERQVNLPRGKIAHALRLLSVKNQAPVQKQGAQWYRTLTPYRVDHKRIAAIKAIRRREQAEMQAYINHTGCLMAFLQRALDDPHARDCGICAGCVGAPLIPASRSPDIGNTAARFLRRSEVAIEPRKMWPHSEALSCYGWRSRIDQHLRAEEGRALSIWGDAGWGHLVKKAKYTNGHFGEDLVSASCELITQRWNPHPAPRWVTSVPSLKRPNLVPDFARRLADVMNLPFVACVRKVKDNAAQKTMNNSESQTRNLNGVFAVDRVIVPAAPVLLVDDTVDSRWTLTVIAALLREAGAGPVLPFTLAESSTTST